MTAHFFGFATCNRHIQSVRTVGMYIFSFPILCEVRKCVDERCKLWVDRSLWRFFVLTVLAICIFTVGLSTEAHSFSPGYPGNSTEKGAIDLGAIAKIESAGCKAPCVGDGGKALGPFQIHPAVVQDFRKYTGSKFSHKDMLDPAKARVVADWYLNTRIVQILRAKRLPDNQISRLRAYNEGFLRLMGRRPPSSITRAYIAKYEKITGATL